VPEKENLPGYEVKCKCLLEKHKPAEKLTFSREKSSDVSLENGFSKAKLSNNKPDREMSSQCRFVAKLT